MAETTLNFTVGDITISAADFYESKALIEAAYSANYPDVDITGAANDQYVKPLAFILAYIEATGQKKAATFDLSQLKTSSALFTDAEIDTILGQYGLTRSAYSSTSVDVIIYFTNFLNTTVPPDITLFSGTNSFKFISEIQFVTSGLSGTQIVEDTPLPYALATVTYTTLSDLTLAAGEALTLDTQIYNIDRVEVRSDYVFSSQGETNDEFIQRAIDTYVTPGADSSSGLQAYISNAFSPVQIEIVNTGRTEMVRDAYNVFGTSLGGKVDVYVQDALVPRTNAFNYSAELIDTDAFLWRMYIPYSQVGAVYKIESVTSSKSLGGSLDIESITYYAGDQPEHDIQDADAYLSARANIEIQFTYEKTNPVLGETRDFWVTVLDEPDIATIQDTLDDEYMSLKCDILARAFYPVFLSPEITLVAASTVDLATLKDLLVAEVNKMAAVDLLTSNIIEIIHDYSTSISVRTPIKMKYEIQDQGSVVSGTTIDTIPWGNLTNPRITVKTARAVLFSVNVQPGHPRLKE